MFASAMTTSSGDSFFGRPGSTASARWLPTRLKYFHAVSAGLLACLPLELRLRGKSTTQSHRTPIYYVDLLTRSGASLSEALQAARASHEERKAAGMDQTALDEAARSGLALGAFEESAEEGATVVEEFYPESSAPRDAGGPQAKASLCRACRQRQLTRHRQAPVRKSASLDNSGPASINQENEMKCPRCGSVHISSREIGMRTCAKLGGLIGAASGANSVIRGAQAGVVIGATIGPVGLAAGGLTGALMAGLLSGSVGLRSARWWGVSWTATSWTTAPAWIAA
jgi:hypothetical protein